MLSTFFSDLSSLFVVWIQRHFHYFSTGCIPSYWCCHHLCRPIVVYNPYRKYHPAKYDIINIINTNYVYISFFLQNQSLMCQMSKLRCLKRWSILTPNFKVQCSILCYAISFARCDTDCLKKRWLKMHFSTLI